MKKTLILTIISIVLIVAVVGTCFALYKVDASPKVINISATEGDTCTLTIGTSASLDFSGINPTNNTKSVDITLSTTDNTIVDGVHGIFKVGVSGTIAEYINVSVNAIPSVGGALGDANAAALTNAGADIALSTLPKYFRITMTLDNEADFADVAEKTGTITVSWTVDQNSLFTYDANAYYVVGTVGGVTSWDPSSTTPKMTTPGDDTDLAKITLNLNAGDEFKCKHGETWIGSYSSSTADFTNNNEQIHINNAGNYTIRIDSEGHFYISRNS